MQASGILPKDRILWVNGEVVFSNLHLRSLVNESSAFLTIERDGTVFQVKVPRVVIDDLNMRKTERAEIGDWQYELGLKGRLQDLVFIPYLLSPNCVIEGVLSLFDPSEQVSSYAPLHEGDRILAVDGTPIQNASEFLQNIQTKKVLMIVQKEQSSSPVFWNQADAFFDSFSKEGLRMIVSSIGTDHPQIEVERLHLLSPIVPKMRSALSTSTQEKEYRAAVKKKLESMEDSPQRSYALKILESDEKSLSLGLPLADLTVVYNPNPVEMFQDVTKDTWVTLTNFFSGYLKPKYMSGPVGIIQAVHHSWTIGFKEVLFWMAVISLNLGIMNLLPIPVLDGGHVLFACIAFITGRPLKAKLMERLMLPFIGLLMFFFVYITYQDLYRLFLQIWH
jgi:regulator of sigma E protease